MKFWLGKFKDIVYLLSPSFLCDIGIHDWEDASGPLVYIEKCTRCGKTRSYHPGIGL